MVEGEHKRKEDCCTILFSDWLQGTLETCSKQLSWESLLSVVEAGYSTETQGEIRVGLTEAAGQSDHQPADPDGKVKECM